MRANLAARCSLAIMLACGIASAGEDDFAARLQRAEQLHSQGKFLDAEKILLAALAEAESFGPQDHRKATVLINLGSVYHSLGNYPEAERFYRNGITMFEKTERADEEMLARSKGNLAVLYMEKGLYDKAEHLGVRSLVERIRSLQPNGSADAARLLATLGMLDYGLARYAEAERWEKEALGIWERLPAYGVETMQTLSNLGILYAATGRNAEALSCYERALRIAETTLSPEHPMQVTLLANVGYLHFFLNGAAKAEPFFKRALAIAENAMGPDHPLVGRILLNYAVVLEHAKRKTEAKVCQRRARAIIQAQTRADPARYTVDVSELITRSRGRRVRK